MTSAATTASLQEADIYIDYKSFLADNFDANAYANATINGSLDGSSGGDGSDVATALAKLSFSVDSLNKQIQDQVASHYEDLLQQVSGIRELENVLAAVKKNIEGLNVSLERLRQKITTPYDQIQASTIQLERLQTASELLRRLIRFLYLARRLEIQLPPSLQEVPFSAGGTLAKVGGSDGRNLAKAALTLNELDSILAESDLQGIDVVESEIPIIQQSRERILAEADRVLDNGMKTENQADIASALQVFYNLRQMVPKVHTIVDTILGELLRQIKHVVDMQSLNKQVKGIATFNFFLRCTCITMKHASSNLKPILLVNRNVSTPHLSLESGGSHSTNIRRLNDPTSTNVALWTQALWGRMEKLMDFMGDCCIKLYVLERVLERKRDPLTHVAFIEEVVKTMDDGNNLVRQFWKVLSANFEKELRDATKAVEPRSASTIKGNCLDLTCPISDLERCFYIRIIEAALPGIQIIPTVHSPEYVLMLRSINSFETAFLSRSLTRMYDPINAAFPSSGPLSRNPPSRNDVTNVVRTISSELDTAKFDAGLLRAVAKNVVKALSMYCMKCEGLIATDPSAYQVVGPGPMSNSQNMNVELINNLYAVYQSVWKVLEEFPDFVVDIVRDGVEATHRLMLSIGEPLVDHIIAELEAVVLKIHREDFSRQTSRNYINTQQDGSSSVYMTELSIRLRYIQTELLTRLSCGEQTKA
ncbi:Golgi transport complex subunit 5-domain-containing protein [Endogone sp. FLAS-F59071]|nr:Golgi transport complex subunit 5-domain-containing protein [Endogone sp. FLAS-F59071]|eukprot:RUS18936.1 Golgi transport complex subunit 5-domain-containing protein [Endogone sp. FLAS-F59071]